VAAAWLRNDTFGLLASRLERRPEVGDGRLAAGNARGDPVDDAADGGVVVQVFDDADAVAHGTELGVQAPDAGVLAVAFLIAALRGFTLR
jgi:hypothetical protein